MNNRRKLYSIEYVDKIEDAKRFMFRMQFVEYHPEPLSYEEIQAVNARLLKLSPVKVAREIKNKRITLSQFKVIFYDLLFDRFATKKWASVKESIYWDIERTIRRLKDEGRSAHYIGYTIFHLYKLQQTIMKKTCDMVDEMSIYELRQEYSEDDLRQAFSKYGRKHGLSEDEVRQAFGNKPILVLRHNARDMKIEWEIM